MPNRKYLIVLLILGAVLTVAGGVLYFVNLSPAQQADPRLSPPPSLANLAEQYPTLAAILKDPKLGSVYKEFLIAYQEGGQESAQKLARQRGLLTPEGDIAITLILDTEENASLITQLEKTGVVIVSDYRDRVNVAVPMNLITARFQSEQPGAIFSQLSELEHVIGVELPETRTPDGAIEGEGVSVISADAWHQAGFTGDGLHIGILDLGFSGYENLLGVELPDSVAVETFGWYDEEEIHGTACAEIVHEVAPDAQLSFAWYDGSDAAMGESVEWLVERGVDIISHSAGGLVGPRDGSEWDAQLVDDLAAQGILWVNSAGNEALSHYRGIFTDEDGDSLHEFSAGSEKLSIENKGFVKIILSWEDSWERASQDYELYLYDAAGNKLAASQDSQAGEIGQEPFEGITYESDISTVYVVVEAYEVEHAVTLDIFTVGSEMAYPSPAHTICTPGDAVGSLTVGAVNWWDDSLAAYSSQGPTSDGRLKPEISAPTGVSGATYGERGFDGTSASCPHTAAAAALVWQAHPAFTRQEVVDLLLSRALDLGSAGPDTGYGYGRLQLASPPAAASPTPSPGSEQPTPSPVSSPAPLSTPTPVAYVTPVSSGPPSSTGASGQGGLLALTGLGLLIGGLTCVGVGLLFIGAIGLLIARRRLRQPRPISQPPTPPRSQPIRCQSCGTPVRAGARFCPACGQPVAPAPVSQPRHCRRCGAALKDRAKFCPRCGQPWSEK